MMKKTRNPSKFTKNLQNSESVWTQYYILLSKTLDGVGFEHTDSEKFGDFGDF
jgi:hypothetical protein